jgi:hypothetical protein
VFRVVHGANTDGANTDGANTDGANTYEVTKRRMWSLTSSGRSTCKK